VLLVVDGGFPADGEARIAAAFRRRLGDTVDVVVERVAAIAPEKSGKYRYIISHVADAAAAPAGRPVEEAH
jgi:phenylacetate-CoA ligase